MPTDGLVTIVLMSLTAMLMISFWRELLIALLALIVVIFCSGLYYLIETLPH